MSHLKIAVLVSGLVLSTGLLAGPAFAVCAEGTPNCLKLDEGHIRAGAFVQNDLKNHGEIDCKGNGLCGHDSGGNPSPLARTSSASRPQHTGIRR
jgi:hypothetical protein